MPVSKTAETSATKYVNAASEDFDVDARPAQPSSDAIGSGWDDAEKLSAPTGDYPVEFKHTEDFQIVKILDADGPFASYKLHFLQQKTTGKRSYVCLQTNCPLCDILDHRPEVKRAFTVVNLSSQPPQRQLLIATPRLYKTMHSAHFSPQGPLNKNFWAISRTGVKQTTVYHFNAVKGRDLNEDWGINEEEAMKLISETVPYDKSVIRETSYQELLEIAESLN